MEYEDLQEHVSWMPLICIIGWFRKGRVCLLYALLVGSEKVGCGSISLYYTWLQNIHIFCLYHYYIHLLTS